MSYTPTISIRHINAILNVFLINKYIFTNIMVLFFFISFIYIFLYSYHFHTFIYYFYSFLCIINIKVYKTYNHQILILSIISLKHFCHIHLLFQSFLLYIFTNIMVLFFFISFIYIFLYNYHFHTFIYYFYSFPCITIY